MTRLQCPRCGYPGVFVPWSAHQWLDSWGNTEDYEGAEYDRRLDAQCRDFDVCGFEGELSNFQYEEPGSTPPPPSEDLPDE